ncbi:MAG: methyltransferase family protein [Promethearchaeota archaeon]
MVIQLQFLFPWIYLTVLLLSLILFSVPYIYSLMPAKLAEKRGASMWKWCKLLRTIGTAFMFIALLVMVLWIWFPIPALAWPINPNPWVDIIIGVIVLIIPIPIWRRGLRDAGSECYEPSKDSQMFGGIYNHIRHPQTLGEISWFIAVPLIVNSLFLLAVSGLFLLIYLPIMIYVEEDDLTRRFGDAYREYQKRTGVLYPKLKKPKST